MRRDNLGLLYILIYLFAWILLFLWQKKKASSFCASLYCITLYITWTVMSVLLYNDGFYEFYYYKLTFFPLVYLFVMILMALWPCICFDRSKVTMIQQPSKTLLYGFLIVYGICAFMSLPSTISKLMNNFTKILYEATAGKDLYAGALNSTSTIDYGVSGIMGLFNIFHNFFVYISFFFFFYYLSLKNRKRGLILYLFVVLVVDLVSGLANGGRTSFVISLLTLGSGIFLFKDYWEKDTRRIIALSAVAVVVASGVIFLALTKSRFEHSIHERSIFGSVIEYTGMAPLVFDKYCLGANAIRNGDRTANEFKRMLGFNPPSNYMLVRRKYYKMNINDGLFYTFVGDFVLDYGPVFAFVIFAVALIVFTKLTKSRNGCISFRGLLILYFSMCICVQGGMYLFSFSFFDNWKIIAFFIMYILLYLDAYLQKGNYTYLIIEKNRQDTDYGKRIIKYPKIVIKWH